MTPLSAALEARDEPAYDDASATLLDALDWIAQALPILKMCRDDRAKRVGGLKNLDVGLIAFDVLIAQAEGKEVGE